MASFPKLLEPRLALNTKPAAASRDPAKLLGYVKPAPVPAGERSDGGIGRVTSHVHVAATKAPVAPVVRRYDAQGRETLQPADVSWTW